jgi:hypothetical protein
LSIDISISIHQLSGALQEILWSMMKFSWHFLFHHRSHIIHDKRSGFVIDS